MHKSEIFLWSVISFIGAVFVRSFFEIGQFWYFGLLLCVIILVTVFYKNNAAVSAALFFLFFLLGLWFTEKAILKANDTSHDGKKISEIAYIIKQPESKQFRQSAIVEFENQKEYGNVLVNFNLHPKYDYGEALSINCVLEVPSNEGLDFDYRMFLAKDHVNYRCDAKDVIRVPSKDLRGFYAAVIKIKNKLERSVAQLIPVPESALGSGIVFGGSGGLSEKVKTDFSRTGMTHIVAVSGYNVTIIAEYFLWAGILFGLWRRQAIMFALAGIAIFVIMIGMPSSAVRAAVMGGVLLWAMKYGRIASSANALVFAAGIMLLLNPLLLRWDIGFQLSFLATVGIVTLSPLWECHWIKKHKALGLSEMILLTLSAQVFVLPIIAYNFKTFSVLSLLANVVVLPIVPLVMLAVFCTALLGAVYTPFALPFAWISYVFLHYIVRIISVIADIPWAVKEVTINVWDLFIYYVLVFALVYIINRRKRKKIMQNMKTKTKYLNDEKRL